MSASLIDPEDKVHCADSDRTTRHRPDSRKGKRRSKLLLASTKKWTQYATPLLAIHLLSLFAFVPSFITWQNVTILVVAILVFGQGINLGYHRLLAHRSLQVPKWLEHFYTILALCCLEETPAKWVSTHRRHHRHSDDDELDPHSPVKRFMWGHMVWLIKYRNGRPEMRLDDRYAKDLLDDPFYRALERHWWLAFAIYLAHAALFYVVALLVVLPFSSTLSAAVWTATGATMWGIVLRTVAVWHITWSVNSLAHTFGYQNYKTGEQSRNNWLVALLASGEGWHNNHHHDQASASLQHKWWEFDLTYYHIKLLEWTGLAKDVIKPRHVRHRERQEA